YGVLGPEGPAARKRTVAVFTQRHGVGWEPRDLPIQRYPDEISRAWMLVLHAAPEDIDPDDEELPETPPDVIMMLGFDPKDEPEPE
ncbi:MAG: hypothetical protein M3Y22_17770, partial [Pseudomonadota bacterium]|nr:hypothetical protein [Pseudomonadota bacterium]